jgi:hypothetical protein
LFRKSRPRSAKDVQKGLRPFWLTRDGADGLNAPAPSEKTAEKLAALVMYC